MNLSLVVPGCRDAFRGRGRALPVAHVAFSTSPIGTGHPSSWPLRGSLSTVGGPDGSVLSLVSPQSTQAHENNRDTRLAWTGMQEHLVSTGFNQVVFPPTFWALPARSLSSPLGSCFLRVG